MGAMGGAGTTGVAIGITIMRSTTTSDITHKAGRSITATDSIETKPRTVLTTPLKGRQSLSLATTEPLAAMPNLVPKAMLILVLSAATAELLAARVEFAPEPSAVLVVAGRNGAFRRAEAQASAAVFMEADATERTQL